MRRPARAEAPARLLRLRRHPEGGRYREIFRSGMAIDPLDGRGRRDALTTILYLLARGERSRWHRVRSDEVWHLLEGEGIDLHLLDPGLRRLRRVRLGRAGRGGRPAVAAPAGWWQAARPIGAWALAGCTVGPGFDFADFALLSDNRAAAARLVARWPAAAALL